MVNTENGFKWEWLKQILNDIYCHHYQNYFYSRVHICPDRQLMPEELKCDPCGLQFTSSRYYMRHFLRQHKTVPPGYENQKVYKCNEQNCDDIFLTPFNLQKHIKIHHSDLPKKSKTEPDEQKYCSRCDQTFAKERFFLMHYKTIHNEIPPGMVTLVVFFSCQTIDVVIFFQAPYQADASNF